jgi:hypothetical protein
MEWTVTTFAVALGLLVLFAPVIMLLGTFFILVPLAHLAPAPTPIARASFECPFARRRVSVAFVTPPDTDTPTDVASCSHFTDGEGIRCAKGCLGLAHTVWTPSAMAPRYSLIADGVAFRNEA